MAKKKKQKSSKSNLLEVQNAAKTLFANIRFQSIDNPVRTILLTSSVPDEGKTTTAWYLAQAIATAGYRVLLVESDMRRRSLARMLQLHPENGLFAVLTKSARLSQAAVKTSVPNLFFLDCEPSIPNPADLLASKRMLAFNEELKEAYDYVIYDTPPVGTFVDAAVLGVIADACILVCRAGRAKRSELQMAYEQLISAGANVIGLCATFVEGTGSEYYYSYYTKDGQKSEEKVAQSQVPAAMRAGGKELPDELKEMRTPEDVREMQASSTGSIRMDAGEVGATPVNRAGSGASYMSTPRSTPRSTQRTGGTASGTDARMAGISVPRSGSRPGTTPVSGMSTPTSRGSSSAASEQRQTERSNMGRHGRR